MPISQYLEIDFKVRNCMTNHPIKFEHYLAVISYMNVFVIHWYRI